MRFIVTLVLASAGGGAVALLLRYLARAVPLLGIVPWVLGAGLILAAWIFGQTSGVSQELVDRGLTGGVEDDTMRRLHRERNQQLDRAVLLGWAGISMLVVMLLF